MNYRLTDRDLFEYVAERNDGNDNANVGTMAEELLLLRKLKSHVSKYLHAHKPPDDPAFDLLFEAYCAYAGEDPRE